MFAERKWKRVAGVVFMAVSAGCPVATENRAAGIDAAQLETPPAEAVQPPPPPPGGGNGNDANDPPAGPGPMGIDPRSQLLITDLRVVEDPVRTDPTSGDRGVWSFKYLMEQMAGDHDPAAFTETWLELWETDQWVNGFVAPARPSIRDRIIDPWLQASGGTTLDLNRAPFKLLAIANRMDLRVHEDTTVITGGEGRFIFGALAPDGTPLPPTAGPAPGGFLIIFEYELTAGTMQALGDWAAAWRRLGSEPLGSPAYNRLLEQVTRRFTDRGRAPGKPNGNPLNQIRTNEVALARSWELREFVIDAATGLIRQNTVADTPDMVSLNGTDAFATLINDAEHVLLDGTGKLAPAHFAASALAGPFLPGDFPGFADRTFVVIPVVDNLIDVPWSASGIRNNDARHALALNTCNGCHRAETGTGFAMIGFPPDHALPGTLGKPAALSGFLRGMKVPDPVDPATTREFDDLDRRKADLEALLAGFGESGDGPGPRKRHQPRFVH